jgi:hypothetical protein
LTETFLCGSHRDTLWEKSYMLVGMADLMCFFRTEPNAVRELLHRIMDWQLGIARHYLRLGVELVSCGDDLGTQSSLLPSSRTVTEDRRGDILDCRRAAGDAPERRLHHSFSRARTANRRHR